MKKIFFIIAILSCNISFAQPDTSFTNQSGFYKTEYFKIKTVTLGNALYRMKLQFDKEIFTNLITGISTTELAIKLKTPGAALDATANLTISEVKDLISTLKVINTLTEVPENDVVYSFSNDSGFRFVHYNENKKWNTYMVLKRYKGYLMDLKPEKIAEIAPILDDFIKSIE